MIAPSPPDQEPRTDAPHAPALRIALLGNPNTGKTTLFNQLTGLRHKTSNFPGTTQDARFGTFRLDGPDAAASDHASALIIDLPGIYSLELNLSESAVCRAVLAGDLGLPGEQAAAPDVVCVVLDATNLARNLALAGEAARRRLPMVVALNMIDLAAKRGVTIDHDALAASLGCPVVPCCARAGEGVAALREAIPRAAIPVETPPGDEAGLAAWADRRAAAVTRIDSGPGSNRSRARADELTDRLDRVLTHPVLGLGAFVLVMGGLFYALFQLAQIPMELIDWVFASLGGLIESVMPEGVLREFLAQGVVGGVGATVIFLPQICLLFFLISLLEDTGYLARAALLMDRVLRPFGLPGHAFVPLLSSHACALPGIMSARAVPDRRERLATILVAPFMTCSARLPVYVLVTTLLFKHEPAKAALAFIGCYALGIAAGVFSALIARRTILRGKSRSMAIELPTFKRPSLRTALLTTYDRGMVFLKKAGTNILAICIILWWLGNYPKSEAPAESLALRQQAAVLTTEAQQPERAALEIKANHLEARHAGANSYAGRLGRFIQPVFAPLGYDWQLTIGVVTSFAAREVFASTMSVVLVGEPDAESDGVMDQMAAATRDDGVTPVFTAAVCWSLLVYYVLAMQCLPTLAVTAREAGGIKWALLQLAWMSAVAYLAALIAFRLALGLSAALPSGAAP